VSSLLEFVHSLPTSLNGWISILRSESHVISGCQESGAGSKELVFFDCGLAIIGYMPSSATTHCDDMLSAAVIGPQTALRRRSKTVCHDFTKSKLTVTTDVDAVILSK